MQAGNKELRSEMQAMAKDLRGEMQNMGTTLGARIDQTNVRLDKTNAILVDFQKEVFVKFAGVTDLLLASENNVARLERRIIKLEDQQASPEKRQDSA